MQPPTSSLLSKIRTREDLEYLASDLEEMRVNLYKITDGKDIPAIIKSEFEKAPDKEAFIESLRQVILSAKVMELTVPTFMDDESVNKISYWVKTNIGQNVVLKFKIDESIMAGTTISYSGKFKDYSFKDALEKAVSTIII